MTDSALVPTQGGQIVAVADRYARELDARSAGSSGIMAIRYAQTVSTLDNELSLLESQIAARQASGMPTPVSWLHKQGRYRSLLEQAAIQFSGYAANARDMIISDMIRAVQLSQLAVYDELGAAFAPGRGIVGNFHRLPDPAIRRLSGHLMDGSPLRGVFNAIPRDAARALRRGLEDGLDLGLNPADVVRRGRDTLLDEKWKSARLVRTEMFRAFREGNREGFKANRDLVDGWIWNAFLGDRTCPACWGMHGQEFDLEEPMGTHPSCRCTMIPKTKSWDDLGFPGIPDSRPRLQTGDEAFARLSAAAQRKILGPGKYDDYARGLIKLIDTVDRRDTPGWGTTRSVANRRQAIFNGMDRRRYEATALERAEEAARLAAETPRTWLDDARALIPDNPSLMTEREVSRLGSVIRQEINRRRPGTDEAAKAARIATLEDEVRDIQNRLDDLSAQSAGVMDRLREAGMSFSDRYNHPDYKRVDDAWNALNKTKYDRIRQLSSLRNATDNIADRAVVKEVLSELRPFGSTQGQNWLKKGAAKFRPVFDQEANWFPTDWLDQSRDFGPMIAKKIKRAHYKHYGAEAPEIALSHETDFGTAVHELAHRFEYTVGNGRITQLEGEFYDRRTAGEPLRHMGRGYGAREVTRRDAFQHPYIGKEYPAYRGRRAYEVLSMGTEALFAPTRRENIYEDEDFLDFILGVLASV
jgi:SPP1 gp7 family putative phage head morphogenesis protein